MSTHSGSKKVSSEEFRFKVKPKEDLVSREERWDAEVNKLQARGLTIQGTGPDGDYPVRYDFDEAGTLSFDEWWAANPHTDTPWFEVYNTKPLPPHVIARLAEAGFVFEEASRG